MIELNSAQTIMLSATVILSYTALGGYYSVVYTDIFQLTSTAIGLWVCVPYVLTNSAAGQLGPPQDDWIGMIENKDLSQIFDHMLTTIFGSIPCQVYFQGVLGSDNAFSAQMLSYLAAVGCLVLAAPSVIIGAVAKSTNFTAMGYPGPYNLLAEHRRNVMPTAIHYMTPSSVSTLGLTAITAAIMSSADSSMLSASCLITRNIYHFIIRPTVRKPTN
ncbi:high-affinity choline transporter 1-like [Dermacentor silvarum]|uniref:high-affinity choline transporter 1-like n=1 Tax=Dermacentor silvarum TaxID=543639 RepID=UPI002101A5CE|nr:high-affinity choline transporter 1-like [Dermacentor silvarum]